MAVKVFSKRHPEEGLEVQLKREVRQRIWYLLKDSDPYEYGFNADWNMSWEGLTESLKREHGWTELRAYKSRQEWEEVNAEDFIRRGVARFVLDATELYHDLRVPRFFMVKLATSAITD